MKSPLTKRQSELLFFIRKYIKEKCCSPSQAEMQKALIMKSRTSARQLVASLIPRGHLTQKIGQYRSIALVEDEKINVEKLTKSQLNLEEKVARLEQSLIEVGKL